MKCITPVTLWRDYATLSGEKTDVVSCGTCHACLTDRRNAWAFRLKHQAAISSSAAFITLTYGVNEKEGFGKPPPLTPNGHETLYHKDVQDFFKRLRKRCRRKLSYYCVGEYGGRLLRPHYHLIIFNLPYSLIANSLRFAKDIWQNGSVDIAPCTPGSICYTVSYVLSGKWEPMDEVDIDTGEILMDDRKPHYSTMSKNLGLSYLTPKTVDYHLESLVGHLTLPGGIIMKMPRYYKDKIFSKDEKAQIAQEMREIHELDLLQWLQVDYHMEILRKKDAIRRHHKQLTLSRQKL